MAQAIVVCRICRTHVALGKERWMGQRALCTDCYAAENTNDVEKMIERSKQPLKPKKTRKRKKKKWAPVDPDEIDL